MVLIRKYKITSVPYKSAPSRYNTYSNALQVIANLISVQILMCSHSHFVWIKIKLSRFQPQSQSFWFLLSGFWQFTLNRRMMVIINYMSELYWQFCTEKDTAVAQESPRSKHLVIKWDFLLQFILFCMLGKMFHTCQHVKPALLSQNIWSVYWYLEEASWLLKRCSCLWTLCSFSSNSASIGVFLAQITKHFSNVCPLSFKYSNTTSAILL